MKSIPETIEAIPIYTKVSGGTIQDEVVGYCKDMEILYPQFFVPIFLSSFACHIANLRNKVLPEDRQVYPNRATFPIFYEHGRAKDLRLHILFVSPPGFMKTFTIEGFLHNEYGFIANCGFPTRFENIVTEAGLVGSAYHTNQGIVIQEGLASKYKNAIIGFEEISSIMKQRTAEYNINLINALLPILDTGKVHKKLVNCEIGYQTYITVWGGNQPEMVNNISGMMRRFLILLYVPDSGDIRKFTESKMKGINVKPKWEVMEIIRNVIKEFYLSIPLQYVYFSDEVNRKLTELKVPHFDWDIFKKFIFGYNLINNYDWWGGEHELTDHIYVSFLPGGQLEKILELLVRMRYQAIMGDTWKDMLALFNKNYEYTLTEFRETLCKVCHLPWRRISDIIKDLKIKGYIRIEKRHKGDSTKPISIVNISRG